MIETAIAAAIGSIIGVSVGFVLMALFAYWMDV